MFVCSLSNLWPTSHLTVAASPHFVFLLSTVEWARDDVSSQVTAEVMVGWNMSNAQNQYMHVSLTQAVDECVVPDGVLTDESSPLWSIFERVRVIDAFVRHQCFRFCGVGHASAEREAGRHWARCLYYVEVSINTTCKHNADNQLPVYMYHQRGCRQSSKLSSFLRLFLVLKLLAISKNNNNNFSSKTYSLARPRRPPQPWSILRPHVRWAAEASPLQRPPSARSSLPEQQHLRPSSCK